jgi:hypothetical protein
MKSVSLTLSAELSNNFDYKVALCETNRPCAVGSHNISLTEL